ncbi:uncharacterized protein [Dermacentor andersoni]|uniref:uncharacterized protein n=1 Tax=Dermacentor andersoni TaxID=34620 RepID=UPI003B3AB782
MLQVSLRLDVYSRKLLLVTRYWALFFFIHYAFSCRHVYRHDHNILFFLFSEAALQGVAANQAALQGVPANRVLVNVEPSEHYTNTSTREHSPHKLQNVRHRCVLCHVELHGASRSRKTVHHINCSPVLCHVELHGASTSRETVQRINCRCSMTVPAPLPPELPTLATCTSAATPVPATIWAPFAPAVPSTAVLPDVYGFENEWRRTEHGTRMKTACGAIAGVDYAPGVFCSCILQK